jgi:hypothetical protein
VAFLSDIVPTAPRGVIGLTGTCATCARPVPAMGRPGKGRPVETFGPGYLCTGHAMRVAAV